MISETAKKIKAIVKGTADKSSFGTNPKDPWSAKANIAEGSGDLEAYLKSRGINPKFVSTDTKIAHSKSGEFAKWKRDHQFEEVQTEQTSTERHSPTRIRAKELQKRAEKHDIIGTVKSEAWDQPDYNQSIKARQAAADKKAKEETKNKIDEGKMGDLAGEIGRHLDKHIDDYKTHGGAEHLGYKAIDTAKKIVKSHNLHPNHAQKFVNDYVEKRLAEDIWKGVTKAYPETKPKDAAKEKQIRAAKDSAILDAIRDKEAKEKKLKGEETYVCPVCGCTPCNCTHISEQDKYADKFGKPSPSIEDIAKKHNMNANDIIKQVKIGTEVEKEHTNDENVANEIARDHVHEKPDYYTKLKKYVEQFDSVVEDLYHDSYAATQMPTDGANSPDDTIPSRRKEMTKSARIIKALYKKHRMVKEDMYDHEKEDKSVASYGKKPKLTNGENGSNEEKSDAAAILSGGKTLTGEPRDTVEIDPMMKKRPNNPEGQPERLDPLDKGKKGKQ